VNADQAVVADQTVSDNGKEIIATKLLVETKLASTLN
jgi:hypothetical protein